jgi:hypothetical protein
MVARGYDYCASRYPASTLIPVISWVRTEQPILPLKPKRSIGPGEAERHKWCHRGRVMFGGAAIQKSVESSKSIRDAVAGIDETNSIVSALFLDCGSLFVGGFIGRRGIAL